MQSSHRQMLVLKVFLLRLDQSQSINSAGIHETVCQFIKMQRNETEQHIKDDRQFRCMIWKVGNKESGFIFQEKS